MTNETRNGAQWSADVDEELLVTLPAIRGDVTQTPLPLDHPRARVRRLRPMPYGILKSEGSFFAGPDTWVIFASAPSAAFPPLIHLAKKVSHGGVAKLHYPRFSR